MRLLASKVAPNMSTYKAYHLEPSFSEQICHNGKKNVVIHKCLTLASNFDPKYGAECLEKMYGDSTNSGC